MKKYSLLLASFLFILLGVGLFLEHESKYFSLLTARVFYSFGDFEDTKKILDSRLEKTLDKRALSYGNSLLGNTKYRLSDLTGAVDSYSDSLRLYEDEAVEKNREFVLQKLRKNLPPEKEQTPPPTAGSGSENSKTSSGASSKTWSGTSSGSWNSKSQSGSENSSISGTGKTQSPSDSGTTTEPGKTLSGSTSSGSTLSGTTNHDSTGSGVTNSGTTNSGTTNSWAVSGKFMQGKLFKQQWNISDQDLKSALENIRSIDREKQKYLQDGKSSTAEDSLLNDLKSFFDDTDQRSLGGNSEEKQDW